MVDEAQHCKPNLSRSSYTRLATYELEKEVRTTHEMHQWKRWDASERWNILPSLLV